MPRTGLVAADRCAPANAGAQTASIPTMAKPRARRARESRRLFQLNAKWQAVLGEILREATDAPMIAAQSTHIRPTCTPLANRAEVSIHGFPTTWITRPIATVALQYARCQ